jgi:hypothetical protein
MGRARVTITTGFVSGRRDILVPAEAGTHNHRRLQLRPAGAPAFARNQQRWLWVPAFAGTTRGLRRPYATLSKNASSAALTASGVPTCIQTPSSLRPNSRSCSLARSNILVSENSPAGAWAKIDGEMIAAPA